MGCGRPVGLESPWRQASGLWGAPGSAQDRLCEFTWTPWPGRMARAPRSGQPKPEARPTQRWEQSAARPLPPASCSHHPGMSHCAVGLGVCCGALELRLGLPARDQPDPLAEELTAGQEGPQSGRWLPISPQHRGARHVSPKPRAPIPGGRRAQRARGGRFPTSSADRRICVLEPAGFHGSS